MRTLEEHQLAMLSVADTRGRADRGVPCVVVAVSRAHVALYPLTPLKVDRLPASIGQVYLSYHQGRNLVALRGVAQAVGHDDIRFCPIDVVQLCKRRSSRLATRASVDLMPLNAVSSRAVSTESVDVSATGLLCVRRGAFDVGDLVKFEVTFDAEDAPGEDRTPVRGVARVLRSNHQFAALDFKDVDASARRRLTEHIILAKRRELDVEVQGRLDREAEERAAAALEVPAEIVPLRGSRPVMRLVR
jgi:hypothetical protein